MQEQVINLSKYISKKRLSIIPEVLLIFISRHEEILDKMLKSKVFESDDISSCKYCNRIKAEKKNPLAFCKKHRSIAEWKKIKPSKAGFGIARGLKFCTYSQYVLVEMESDPKGVYVIWIRPDISDQYFNVYCIKKENFENLFQAGHDLGEILNQDTIIIYKNWQMYSDEENKIFLSSIK